MKTQFVEKNKPKVPKLTSTHKNTRVATSLRKFYYFPQFLSKKEVFKFSNQHTRFFEWICNFWSNFMHLLVLFSLNLKFIFHNQQRDWRFVTYLKSVLPKCVWKYAIRWQSTKKFNTTVNSKSCQSSLSVHQINIESSNFG